MIVINIHVSDEVAKWYKDELTIDDAAQIRFHVRYGGIGGHIPGFSLGLKYDTPDEVHASTTVDNITFFIESMDEWYFDGKDLEVTLNRDMSEPEFIYIKR